MNKTQKRSSSPTNTNTFTQNDNLNAFLDNENTKAYSSPWHRLDKGLRLNRMRDFADKEGKRLNLSDTEIRNLHAVLQKALLKGNLSSKATVVYNCDKQEISEIKGLVMHRNSSGDMLFQIIEKKNGITFRKPKVSAAVEAQPVESSQTECGIDTRKRSNSANSGGGAE